MIDVLAWHRALAVAGLHVILFDASNAVDKTSWVSIIVRGRFREHWMAVDARNPERLSTWAVYGNATVPVTAPTMADVIRELQQRAGRE